MPEISVPEQERDVEQARTKLAADLATLRSPETFTKFTDDLKNEALHTKDAVLYGLVESLKAKATANPVAALAIGAGLAWRFVNHPPIASALVGIGLFSLWRTDASRPLNGYPADYLEEGKQRLKEQGTELVSKITDLAGDAQQTIFAKAAEFADVAKDKMQQTT